MPISNPAEASVFNADYAIVGEYASDDSRIPYFNPADSSVAIQPGEPVVMTWNGAKRVFIAQDIIRPGKTGYLIRRFTVDLPCDFSANVIFGTKVAWDYTNKKVSLAADATNAIDIGNIVYAPPRGTDVPTVDGNGRVICGTATSTKCRVMSRDEEATVKGTVPAL